jgi:four helix bundle protein
VESVAKWKLESGKWKRMAKTELETRTKEFALELIDLVERMPRNRAGDVVGKQLLRSGTSIGANYREANRAESRADFHHKLGISTKESAETEFWLELVHESEHLQTEGCADLLKESGELIAILMTIGRNSKKSTKP